MSEPYVPLLAGEVLTAEDWNRMQTRHAAELDAMRAMLQALELAIASKERAVQASWTAPLVGAVTHRSSLQIVDSGVHAAGGDVTVPGRGTVRGDTCMQTDRGLNLACSGYFYSSTLLQVQGFYPLTLSPKPMATFSRPMLVEIAWSGVAVTSHLSLTLTACVRGSKGTAPVWAHSSTTSPTGQTRPTVKDAEVWFSGFGWTASDYTNSNGALDQLRSLGQLPQKADPRGGVTLPNSGGVATRRRFCWHDQVALPAGTWEFIPHFQTQYAYQPWPRLEHYPYLLELNQRVLAFPLDP